MSDDIIKNREIKGVAGNKTYTSLAVNCGFYPIVKFELSDFEKYMGIEVKNNYGIYTQEQMKIMRNLLIE